ncbi:MAG: alanine racemase, partial [Candidatus Nanopelagicales bacterium]
MSLVLQLDVKRWQQHITEFATGIDLVPVIKGNGYGLGFPRLVSEVNRLKLDLIAVDTIAEAQQLRAIWDKQILVMQPVRATDDYQNTDFILTVDSHSPKISTPVVVEMKTKLQRFGIELSELNLFADYQILGYGIHLPIGGTTNYSDAKEIAEALPDQTLFVSHLSRAEL